MGSPAGSKGVRQSVGSVGGGSETLRIKLLGGFSVSVGSRTIQQNEWRLRKAAALVKVLALGYVDENGEEREASYRCRRCADSR